MSTLEVIRQSLLNDPLADKLEFLRTIVSINISILIAVIGLVFLLYQIDKYGKFKSIKYIYMSCYLSLGIVVGLAYPIILIHITGSSYTPIEDFMYLVSVASPFVMVVLSALYLTLNLRTMSTKGIVKNFKYVKQVSLKGYLDKSVEWMQRFRSNDNKDSRRSKKYSIGRDYNPVSNLSEQICLQHGVVMQEWNGPAKLSDLYSRDDRLVRMAATAIEENDSKTLKQIARRYGKLLELGDNTFFDAYSQDLESIGAMLVRHKKDEWYDFLLDILSDEWIKDRDAFDGLDDRLGRLYAGMIYQYLDKGESIESTQKVLSLLMNFYFLVIESENKKTPRDWFYTTDACQMYIQRGALRVAEKGQGFSLWLMHEKAVFFAHHGAEVKKVGIAVTFMKLIANIGIIGKVYDLHCGASDCSKSIYQHALEAFESLGGYYKETFTKKASDGFITNYKDALEKLTGYEVNIDFDEGTYTTNKKSPKVMHVIKAGPSKETSDSQKIDYSNLDKDAVGALMRSRRGSW